jgi:hypothetical protein
VKISLPDVCTLRMKNGMVFKRDGVMTPERSSIPVR